MGEPKVTDMIPTTGYDDKSLLKLAYSLETKSEHPLAKAVVVRQWIVCGKSNIGELSVCRPPLHIDRQ